MRDEETNGEIPAAAARPEACNSQEGSPAKAGSQEFSPGLPRGQQEPGYLRHQLLGLGSALAGYENQEPK